MTKFDVGVENGVLYVTKPDGTIFTYDREIKTFSPISKKHSNFHDYGISTLISKKGESSLDNVFKALLYFPAPQSQIRTQPVKNNEIFDIIGPLRNVRTIVLPEHRMVINIALAGHGLEPGIVVRHVHEDRNGNIFVSTNGVGNGLAPGLNAPLGKKTFHTFDKIRIKEFVQHWGVKKIPDQLSKKEMLKFTFPTEFYDDADTQTNEKLQQKHKSNFDLDIHSIKQPVLKTPFEEESEEEESYTDTLGSAVEEKPKTSSDAPSPAALSPAAQWAENLKKKYAAQAKAEQPVRILLPENSDEAGKPKEMPQKRINLLNASETTPFAEPDFLDQDTGKIKLLKPKQKKRRTFEPAPAIEQSFTPFFEEG